MNARDKLRKKMSRERYRHVLEDFDEPMDPKVVKVDMGVKGRPLFDSYLGCGRCERELDKSFSYCPECGQRIGW